MFGKRKRRRKGAMMSKAAEAGQGRANSDLRNRDGEYPLTNVGNGCCCRVRRHRAQGAIRQRLLDMGFIPNTEIEVVRVATLGDPIEVRVGDSWITLRKSEADKIDVSDC